MKEEQTEIITKEQAKAGIKEQVQQQMATLSTRIPTYEELSEEERKTVDEYIAKINISDSSTIDQFGREETEEIYEELDILIGTMQTHDLKMGDSFAELMATIGDDEEEEPTGIRDMIKSPFKTMRTLKNKAKKTAEKEKYRRAKVMSNLDGLREKLEGIRIELRANAGKLEIMAQNSADQYNNTQYQIIALQETLRRIREGEIGEQQGTAIAERTFAQIDRSLRLTGVEKQIQRKIANCQGILVNAATKAIMSRLLAIHNEELASNYEQDISSLLPELKGTVVISQANDSLISGADIHNRFVGSVNEVFRKESERSKEALQKVQNISTGSVIEVETARTLVNDVFESVKTLTEFQQKGHVETQAFTEIMSDFREKMAKQLQVGQQGKPELQAGIDR